MSDFEVMAIAVVAAGLGGAAAARIVGIELWRGALVGVCAAIGGSAAFFIPGIDRNLSMPMACLIAAGVTGSLIGLTPTRTAHVAIGAALPPLIGFLILELGS